MIGNPSDLRTIDEYIAACPEGVRPILAELRAAIRAAAPKAEEKISYQMPTFYLEGNLVHFAAFKHHIGFYPAPTGIQEFAADLAAYACSKGAIRFPIGQPLPLELIGRIVAFRVAENLKRAELKAGRKR